MDAHKIVAEDMDTSAVEVAPAPAKLEDSYWTADSRPGSFHIAVAASFEEGSTQVGAASLEHIREAARFALCVGDPEGTDGCLCGCAEVTRGGGGAFDHVSFLATFALALFPALFPALCLCCTCGV